MEDKIWKGPRIPVAVLGATGSVGQRFVSLLAEHPWFEPRVLSASSRSAGRPYGEAAQWVQAGALDPAIAALTVAPTEPAAVKDCPLVFSALDAAVAGPAEAAVVGQGHLVVSNARSHRMAADVPLVVPEVNGEHLTLVERQRAGDATRGAIVTNPNCSTIGLVLALKPLVDRFGVSRAHVVTLQAISGAGLPGISSYQILDNVIPHIAGEEEKMEAESRKILGRLVDGGIEDHGIEVSAQCNRVPVIDGHTLCISVGLGRTAEIGEVREAFDSFQAEPQRLRLPSAPERPIRYVDAPDAPQARLHRDLDGGMATVIGRLRPCPLFDYKFVVLSHNTMRGAARGSILVAEQAVSRGLLPGYDAGGAVG